MRVLHTSDWHLGQRLVNNERTEEHQAFLTWLCKTIQEQEVELLLITGDIFDTGSPSNAALKLYYDFLQAVCDTCCQHVIVIGGNHDSVATLNAPRQLLRYFNVHVVGGAPADPLEQIIPLSDQHGKVRMVVCAVPFLRDRDVRLSVPGENFEEREARIRQGICDHYDRLVPHLQAYKDQRIPVIGTGHLYAAGGQGSESEKEIHVGNLGQVRGDQFPCQFDYVALGHLHRPQKVNETHHIRYSGSPIPLSFSEVTDRKVVFVLDFAAGQLADLREIEIPVCRKLVRFKGAWEKVKQQLLVFDNNPCTCPAWAEIQIELEEPMPDLHQQLESILDLQPHLQMLILRPPIIKNAPQGLDTHTRPEADLHDLKPQDVFRKRCESVFQETDYSELLVTFQEMLELMGQEED